MTGDLDVLLDDLRLFADEAGPQEVYQRVGEEFKTVLLVAIVEDLEELWPQVVNVGLHEGTTLRHDALLSHDPVRCHQQQDSGLDFGLVSEVVRDNERLAQQFAPGRHGLGEDPHVSIH